MKSFTKRFLTGIMWASWASAALSAPAANATLADPSPPATEPLKIQSPDGTMEATIYVDGPLRYGVTVDGQPIVEAARLGLKLREGTMLGADVKLSSSATRSEDSTWENPLGKRRDVRDQYRELTLLLTERSAKDRTFQLVFRVFDDGVAFRYVLLSQPGLRDFVLDQELTEFRFPADATCYTREDVKGSCWSQEWEYRRQRLSEIAPDAMIRLPLLVETPAAWVAIAEADLLDWSGMSIAGKPAEEADQHDSEAEQADASPATAVTLVAQLAPRLDGEGLVKAETPHRSSWRVLMIGRQPGRLVESEIIRNLSTPSKLADSSWIQPGTMACRKQSSNAPTIDTATIESDIQRAADLGWKYLLIDSRWYIERDKPGPDVTKAVPALDLDEVRRFAAEKGVRLWLSLDANDLDRDEAYQDDAYQQAFPLYEQWHIAGVTIEPMDRSNQDMAQWYEKIAAAAAEHQLMVRFHGTSNTRGFDRTYPNQVGREGTSGIEHNQSRTRAGELAIFVCDDSPVRCVCDEPEKFRDRPAVDFLRAVPTVWDETLVLDSAVGERLVVARQSGDDWYLGAITNSEPREIAVKLDFLDGGRWKLKLWQDVDDSDQNREQLAVDESTVSAGDTITLNLAPAGGCVGQFKRE